MKDRFTCTVLARCSQKATHEKSAGTIVCRSSDLLLETVLRSATGVHSRGTPAGESPRNKRRHIDKLAGLPLLHCGRKYVVIVIKSVAGFVAT